MRDTVNRPRETHPEPTATAEPVADEPLSRVPPAPAAQSAVPPTAEFTRPAATHQPLTRPPSTTGEATTGPDTPYSEPVGESADDGLAPAGTKHSLAAGSLATKPVGYRGSDHAAARADLEPVEGDVERLRASRLAAPARASVDGTAADEMGFDGDQGADSTAWSSKRVTELRKAMDGEGGVEVDDATSEPKVNHDGVAKDKQPERPERVFRAACGVLNEEDIERYRQEDTREVIDKIAPPGMTSINAGGRVGSLALGYRLEVAIRRPPQNPTARAEMLNRYLSSGQKGAEELAEMVRTDHPILQDIRTANGGETIVRHLLMGRLSSAVAKLSQNPSPTDDSAALMQRLSHALSRLDPRNTLY